jgi:hypothetical protein
MPSRRASVLAELIPRMITPARKRPAVRCYCCDRDVPVARKAKIRPWLDTDLSHTTGPDDPAYIQYREQMTYRWAVVCNACYRILDNRSGLDEINGKLWNIAGASRGDKAAVLDERKYAVWQRREAQKLGLDGG